MNGAEGVLCTFLVVGIIAALVHHLLNNVADRCDALLAENGSPIHQTHEEWAKRITDRPCRPEQFSFNNNCLNCGWSPARTK